MSSAVASVEFKAINQQQVVSAFKSVGDSASAATTKVSQNSSAMKNVGQGMKTSVSSIGQVATAFATLSLSIVNTWRSYRDLHSQQLDIDKMNTKIAKAEESLRKERAKLTAATAAASKGGLEYKGHQLDIANAQKALGEAQKKYGKKSLEAATAQQKLNEVQASGNKGSKTMIDLENSIALKEEGLANMKGTLAQKQKSYNDTIQDFYLSIAPLAISTVATLTTAFSGLKGALTGGGGLAGLGPIGLILGGITLAIIAFKTNFLGLRDAVGGVIKWLQDRFGAWKQTIQEVFGFIQKGDWQGAFNRIKQAAIAFWEDLKKTVPFFGTLDTIISKLKAGDWQGAFHMIAVAATQMWADLKKAVPFFGGAEIFIKQLAAGNWAGAWNTIAQGAKTAFAGLFGEKGVLKFQLMRDTAVAEFNLLARTLTQKGGAIDLIQQGLNKLGKGDIVGGFSGIVTGINKAIAEAKAAFFSWVQTNFGIDLKSLESKALAIGNTILTKIKEGLTFIAHTWIDPILKQLFDPAAWTAAGAAILGTIQAIGGTIFNFLAGAIQGAAKDPKGTASWWGNIGKAIWDGIVNWMTTNLPETTKAIQSLVNSFVIELNKLGIQFQNAGRTLWNNLVDGFKAGMVEVAKIGPLGGLFTSQIKDAINSPEWKNLGHLAMIPIPADTKPLIADAKKGVTTVSGMKPKIQVTANTNPAIQLANQARNKINQMKATIQVTARANVGSLKGFSAGAHFQHGTNTTVKRPTMFMAGEGGRPEDVYVKPRGSAGIRPDSGGGGFNGDIIIYLDGNRIDQGMRYRINKGSSVVK